MSINKDRFRRYLAEMKALQERVGTTQFVTIFNRKLQDLLSRGLITKADLKGMEDTLTRLFGDSFQGFQQRLFTSYDDVIALLNEEYDDLGGDISRRYQKMQDVERVSRLQLDSYEASTRQAIIRTVREGLMEDLSARELTDKLRPLLDKSKHYAKTLAQTQIKRYGRAGKYRKALQAGVEYFFYAGVLRDTTRRFCRICLHKIFHISTILRMQNGNLEPVILNCGGWNCIHDWEPDPTASAEDAASGEMFIFETGNKTIKVFGPDGTDKVFRWSEGFERITQGGLERYIEKARKTALKQKVINHIRNEHRDLYGDWSDKQIRDRFNTVRNNPDNMYYQHQSKGKSGPRIVFEKDGEFVFSSASGARSMFKPAVYEGFFDGIIQYLINLNELL